MTDNNIDRDDICGSTDTDDDSPCKNNPSRDDGKCHIHTDLDDQRVKVGRPTDLTHELQERIAADLEAGMPITDAAPKNGISETTYHEWRKRGEEEEEGVFAEFADRVARARGYGQGSLISDAVSIAREKQDGRLLLKAYQEIKDGQRSQEDEEAKNVIPIVLPDSAKPPETRDEIEASGE